MKELLMLMLLAGCFLTFICPTMGQSQTPLAEKPTQADAAIPDQFRPLYQDLDETLRQDRQTYPFKKGNARPLVAPNLLMASSMFGPATSDSQRWKDLLATLDAYKTMKMDAVFVLILAPDLTFGDSRSSHRLLSAPCPGNPLAQHEALRGTFCQRAVQTQHTVQPARPQRSARP